MLLLSFEKQRSAVETITSEKDKIVLIPSNTFTEQKINQPSGNGGHRWLFFWGEKQILKEILVAETSPSAGTLSTIWILMRKTISTS